MAIIKLLSLKIICDYFKRKRPLSPAVQHCCSLPTSVHLLPILCVVLIFGIFFIFLSFSRYRCSIDPSIFFFIFLSFSRYWIFSFSSYQSCVIFFRVFVFLWWFFCMFFMYLTFIILCVSSFVFHLLYFILFNPYRQQQPGLHRQV